MKLYRKIFCKRTGLNCIERKHELCKYSVASILFSCSPSCWTKCSSNFVTRFLQYFRNRTWAHKWKIPSIITHTEFCLIHDYYVVRRDTEGSGTALHKLKSQEFNSHLRSLWFFIYVIIPPPFWPWFYSASKRKEHQEYLMGSKCGRGVKLKTLPPSYIFYNFFESGPPGSLRVYPGLYMD